MLVAVTTPEINNLHAVAVDGDGGSDLLAAGHIAAETSASLPHPSSTSPAIVPGDTNRDERRFHRRLPRVAALGAACLAVTLADRVICHAMCEPTDYRSASLAAIWPTMATAAGWVWL